MTTLTRKGFFRHGFYTLGEALLGAGDILRHSRSVLCDAQARLEAMGEDQEKPSAPVAGPDMVAKADNRHCLSKNCGCFSCMERCEAQAISLVPGEGISIDQALCTGCGECREICPLAPEALTLVPRS